MTNAQLTVQQAADHFGISRTTLVRLLDRGELPFTLVDQHRRVALEDLLEYENTMYETRRQTLSSLTTEAAAAGIYFEHPDTSATR